LFQVLDEILRAHRCIEEEFDSGSQKAQNALRQFKRNMLGLSMVIVHELGHAFNAFLNCMHGNRMRAYTPDDVAFSPFTGYLPDKKGDKPNPRKIGEAGDALQYYAWGGTIQFRPNEESAHDDFDNFVWSRLVLQVWVDGAYKYRVIPDELVDKFFGAPEGELVN
jgi:hypothetical protein